MRRVSGRRSLTALTMVVAAVGAVAGGQAVHAAFVATTPNAGNTISSGTVAIGDNDSGASMLTLSTALPGASDTACIKVSYTGSLPAGVRLYGATTGTGLDQYLELTITRGTYSGTEPAFDSCTNFSADAQDYIGAGAGVVYRGTVQGFGDDYATGLIDPNVEEPESWTTGEARVYKLHVALQNDYAAEGKSATQRFTWEARNE